MEDLQRKTAVKMRQIDIELYASELRTEYGMTAE